MSFQSLNKSKFTLTKQRSHALSNHLGNVLSTISDAREATNSSGNVSEFVAHITSTHDYYPFGMTMEGERNVAGEYRYSFNGMEKDDEIRGKGNSHDFGVRMYDPRVGRWLSRDRRFAKYPHLSPDHFSNNNPIIFVDYNGEDFGVKIDHDKKTIVIVANYYTTSKKAHKEALSTANLWEEQGANIGGYDVSFEITVQEPRKATTEDVIQLYKEKGWEGLYKENGKLDKKKVREVRKEYSRSLNSNDAGNDPNGNLYESNHGENSKVIKNPTGKTTAGVTESGSKISMFTFVYTTPQGNRIVDNAKSQSMRAHEFGHKFGLDDKGGKYHANDGIMVYKFKMNDLSTKDIKNIVQYANDAINGKKTSANVTLNEEKGTTNTQSPIQKKQQ